MQKLGSILGPDSAEHPLKPWYKTQNQAKRFNRLDNRNCFGTRRNQFVSPRVSIIYIGSLGPFWVQFPEAFFGSGKSQLV